MKKNEIIKTGSVIENIRGEYNLEEKGSHYKAFRHWQDIVGRRVAEHTAPLYIVDSKLYVRAQGSSWSQEIAFRKNEIIEKLNKHLGSQIIKDIRYKIL